MSKPAYGEAKRNDDQDVDDSDSPFVSRELAYLGRIFFCRERFRKKCIPRVT